MLKLYVLTIFFITYLVSQHINKNCCKKKFKIIDNKEVVKYDI